MFQSAIRSMLNLKCFVSRELFICSSRILELTHQISRVFQHVDAFCTFLDLQSLSFAHSTIVVDQFCPSKPTWPDHNRGHVLTGKRKHQRWGSFHVPAGAPQAPFLKGWGIRAPQISQIKALNTSKGIPSWVNDHPKALHRNILV